MTTYPMHYTDNANSWHRILMLWRLYWPGLKLGYIICAILPFVAVFLSAMLAHFTGSSMDLLSQWPISLLIYLSPIMLARRDYRDVSSQLPVTAAEKLGFLLLTFWVAVPAVIHLSANLGELLSVAVFGSHIKNLLNGAEQRALTMLQDYGFDSAFTNKVFGFTSIMAMIAIELYYLVKVKHNRILAVIATMLTINFASGILAGILGACIGFYHGYHGKAAGLDDAQITAAIIHATLWIMSTIYVLVMTAAIIYLIKLYKRLRNCGF